METLLISVFALVLIFLFLRAVVKAAIKHNDFSCVLMLIVLLVSFVYAFDFSREPEFTDMSQASTMVVHVDQVHSNGGQLFVLGKPIEVDPSVDTNLLLERREEVVLRVKQDRISIIDGDNGQF